MERIAIRKTKQQEIAELEAQIRHHNKLYFEHNRPEISDEEFDQLVERLKVLRPKSKVLQELGSDLSVTGEKVEHSSPMLSLDKCYNLDDLMRWAEKFAGDVVVSPKIDGAAIAIRYDEKGELTLAETRGDGFKGEDITKNVRQIEDIPRKVSETELEVRGEVYMKRSIFEKYRNEFANPRNLAAGALKQKDPIKTKEYGLNFFAYELIGKDYPHEMEKVELLKRLGFIPVETCLVTKDQQAFEKIYQEFFTRREKLDYELDGVVYKANLLSEQTRLGASAHHPRWAIAYKFQGDVGTTELLEVEWSVSRTGTITPIGLVKPIELSGARVSRVSLHNVGIIKKLGVTLGSKVTMVRSGGVIPKLEAVLTSTKRKIVLPKKCPSCGFATELRDEFLHCTNPQGCRKTKLGELRHFVDVLEIEGFGDKLIEQLYDNGFVEEVDDFFKLKVEDLVDLERVGQILAEKLIKNVREHRKVPLELFLRALGISELGKHVASVLKKNFHNLETILQTKESELAEIHTIGPVTAKEVGEGLRQKTPLIKRLLKHVELVEKARATGALAGKSFLFTGKLAAMTRGEAEKKVLAHGGEMAAGVSRDLDFLVIGSEGYRNQEKGSKWIKAEGLIRKGADLKIISEEEFLKKINK